MRHDCRFVESSAGRHLIDDLSTVVEEDERDSIVGRGERVHERARRISDVGPSPADRTGHVHHQGQVHHSTRRLTQAVHAQLLEVPEPHERRRQNRLRLHGHDVDASGDIGRQGEKVCRRGGIGRRVRPHVAWRKVRLEDANGLRPRIAAVQRASGPERGTVDRLRQLCFHDVAATAVDGQTGEKAQAGEDHRHVGQREPFLLLESFTRRAALLFHHVRRPYDSDSPRSRRWNKDSPAALTPN